MFCTKCLTLILICYTYVPHGVSLDVLGRYRRQFGTKESSTETHTTGNQNVVMACDFNEGDVHYKDALILNLGVEQKSDEILNRAVEQQSQIQNKIHQIENLQNKMDEEQIRIEKLFQKISVRNSQLISLVRNLEQKFVDSPFDNNELNSFVETSVINHDHDDSPIDAEYEENDFIISEDVLLRAFADPFLLGEEENETIIATEVIETTECRSCLKNEYCSQEGEVTRCFECRTSCPKGYVKSASCGGNTDMMCSDIDECVAVADACPDFNTLCVNTAGGYLCLGSDAFCKEGYFYSARMAQCEVCSRCPSKTSVVVPCTKYKDVICSAENHTILSETWGGHVLDPKQTLRSIRDLNNGFSIPFKTKNDSTNQTIVSIQPLTVGPVTSLMFTSGVTARSQNVLPLALKPHAGEASIVIQKHGIVWVEFNLAVRHSCQSYVQVTVVSTINANNNINAEDVNSDDDAVLGYGDIGYHPGEIISETLAGTRIEYSRGERYKPINLACAAEVIPQQNLQIKLHSAHAQCSTKGKGKRTKNNILKALSNQQKSSLASMLWLSHDSGAVAFRAGGKATGSYGSLYAKFVREYASDLHAVSLTTDGRYIQFRESGIALLKYHQALYTVGQRCIDYGITISANVLPRSNMESSETIVRAHKAGVSYTDTALSLTAITKVKPGDMVSFDIQIPSECQARYFNDLNLGVVNVLWIPSGNAETLIARADDRQPISGSVKNKAVEFIATDGTNPAVIDIKSKSYVVFKKTGRVVVNFSTKTKHSCDYLKTTLMYIKSAGIKPEPIMNQVIGDTREHWDGVTMGGAFTVESDALCYVTMTCIRGRINEVAFGESSTLFVLWVPV